MLAHRARGSLCPAPQLIDNFRSRLNPLHWPSHDRIFPKNHSSNDIRWYLRDMTLETTRFASVPYVSELPKALAANWSVIRRRDTSGEFLPLIVEERGAELSRIAEAVIANLPTDIAQRELAAVGGLLGWPQDGLSIRTYNEAAGPGNCLMLTMAYEHVCEVATAFGRIGASSEAVAAEAVRNARAYLDSDVPVGSHLADQLILPMALAAGGRYITGRLSDHTLTNLATVRQFLGISIEISGGSALRHIIDIKPNQPSVR
ncbi:MAG: hypothetical protein HC869_02320 [Rhodospirillales bacterium]|nr:hypothetical protein [Rhodospirillales bacterium]